MRRALASVLFLVLLLPGVALAGADPLIPARPLAAPDYAGEPPLYDDPRFEPWDYTFEGQEWNRSDYATLYFWMNQLQVGKAWALKMAIRTVEYAVHANLVTPLSAPTAAISRRLDEAFWSGPGPGLFLGGMALAALWALWLRFRGQASRAWGTLAGTLLILLLSSVAASLGQPGLQAAVLLSRAVAVEIFQAASGEQNLVVRGGDAAWRVLVYEPWLTGELSEQGRAAYRTPDGLDGGDFLAMSVTERQNICLNNTSLGESRCPWWGVEYLPRRMLLTLWTTAAGLSVAGALVVMGGSILITQLTLLFFVALAPLWLMVALWWPEGGLRLVNAVLVRLFGALWVQVMLTAALVFFLALSATLQATFAGAGWMLVSVLMTALAWLLLRYRYTWWQPLAMAAERVQRWSGSAALQKGGERTGAAPSSAPARAAAATSYSALPDSLIMPRALPAGEERSPAQPPTTLPARSAPMLLFTSQMQRLSDEIALRQEWIRQRQSLERPTPPRPDA